jgi:Cys-rich protein (TIGR01571 family)
MAEDEDRQWNAGLTTEFCLNCCTCCFGTCFPMCALATVKSQFDGSDLCFNCICFSWNVSVVRHYIRTGYGIEGQAGYSDCCLSCCCMPCVITQLLNEVAIRGPRMEPELSINDHPWSVKREEVPICSDPCDTCFTFCCATCEVTNSYSQLTGAVSHSTHHYFR